MRCANTEGRGSRVQGNGLNPAFRSDGIALQTTDDREGLADTGDLTLAYAFDVDPAPSRQLHIRGGVRRVGVRADKVNVYLHLLEDAGRELEKTLLYASGYKPHSNYIRRPSTFDTTVRLSPEAAAIAFSAYVQRSRGRR